MVPDTNGTVEINSEPVESCTILTTAAVGVIEAYHHRMPIIIDPANYDQWLDQTIQEQERIEPLLTPYGADELRYHAVSTWVNNPQHEGEACVAAF